MWREREKLVMIIERENVRTDKCTLKKEN